MRETRIAQRSIFDTYSEHDIGVQLKNLSDLLDGHLEILPVIKNDIVSTSAKPLGRAGRSVELFSRCLLLKQSFRLTYQQLAFHLPDSMSYRILLDVVQIWRRRNHVCNRRLEANQKPSKLWAICCRWTGLNKATYSWKNFASTAPLLQAILHHPATVRYLTTAFAFWLDTSPEAKI